MKARDSRTLQQVLQDTDCPCCGMPARKYRIPHYNHAIFDHGKSVVVQWSDGPGMTTTGPICTIVPADGITCAAPGCLETPQNRAVDLCCRHLIERNATR